MASAPPAPSLDDRLAALAARVRRQRVVRGACWLVVAALLSAGLLILADVLFTFSTAARCLLQIGWVAALAILGLRLIARPWYADPTPDDLGRQVEEHFPGIGDRLQTLAALQAETDPRHPTPQLITTLVRDTERRTRDIDFLLAAPARPVVRLAAVAGGLLVSTVAAVVAVPGFTDEMRRVAMPWYRSAGPPPYRVVVTSGEPVVRRGDPVTLTAYLEPAAPGIEWPDTASVVIRDGPGIPEQSFSMAGDTTGAFHFTRPAVTADFEYRVRIGSVFSDWHTITVADPTELTNQTAIELAPPAYAVATVPTLTVTGFTGIDGLAHSTATLRLRFSRPAATAVLDWRPDGRLAAEADQIPVQLSPDGTAGTAMFRLRESGTLRLVLLNEFGPRKFQTETAIPVRVTPDTPPRFEELDGVPARPVSVRPGGRIPVAVVAVDDTGVAVAELEYTVGNEPQLHRLPIPLIGADTRRAEGRVAFDLAGKGKDGDTVRFRIRVVDNRRVANAQLGPQDAVYPPAGWAEVRLSDAAPPLDRQDVFGRRDAVRDALLAAQQELTQARATVEMLLADAARPTVPLDHDFRRDAARAHIRAVIGRLRHTATDAALTPDLRPLATAIRDVTDRPLRDADESLRAATADDPAGRTVPLDAALVRLRQAGDRMGELLQQNERTAQARLDRRRLDTLASEQEALADRAKAGTGVTPEELLKGQQALRTRLRELLAESEPLRRGVDAAAGRAAHRLAAEAKALAGRVHDLDAAADQLAADVRRAVLEEVRRTQAGVAGDAAGRLARAATAARLARVSLPDAAAFARVADLIARDRLLDALTELEKLTQSLDRVAAEFDKWDAERKDPKIAAKQIALWQDDLRGRFAAATRDTPFDKLPEMVQADFRAEGRALLAAAERLSVPPAAEIVALRDASLVHLRLAAKHLAADGAGAGTAMTLAAETLAKLAGKLPTARERLARTAAELDRIRTEQESITTAAELVLRQYDKQAPDAAVRQAVAKKLAAVQDRQHKLAGRLASLDLPGLEPRQARAAVALKAAAADLAAGPPYDSAASLAWAKRELDRLRQATEGTVPVDARADALARLQGEVADAAAALGDRLGAKQLAPLVATQQDVGKQLATLAAPEAASLLNDARDAARLAEAGFRDGSTPDELRRRTRAAADALARLAARLNGRESDRERVIRLAAPRRRAAEHALTLVGKPFNPDVSGEEKRRLAREWEELTHTRVGADGQAVKKKALDFHARLQSKTEPDRDAAGQRQLADALDELADVMTDVAELAAKPRGPNPPGADAADGFLPSTRLADDLRETVKRLRAVREGANAVGDDVADRIRPADANPLAALEQRQRELAGDITNFGLTLKAGKELADQAAKDAILAADRLRVGQVRQAKTAGELAAQRVRKLAEDVGTQAAADLVAKQEAVLSDLTKYLDNPAAAATQLVAGHEALATKARELAATLDRSAAGCLLGSSSSQPLTHAADLTRKAAEQLADGAAKLSDGTPTDADRSRSEAEKVLALAAGEAGRVNKPEGGTAAAGEKIREADAAMREAADRLGPDGDTTAAEHSMRRAAGALKGAAKLVGTEAGRVP